MEFSVKLEERSGWWYASLGTSSLTFLITMFFAFKHCGCKAGTIAINSSISAAALLTLNIMLFFLDNNPRIKINIIFVLYGIIYSFSFRAFFYACICFNRHTRLLDCVILVNLNYIWMVGCIATPIVSSILLGGGVYNSVEKTLTDHYYLKIATSMSIWGFIFLSTLLIWLFHGKISKKVYSTLLIFTGFQVVAGITITASIFSSLNQKNVTLGAKFICGELPIELAILTSVFFARNWTSKIGSVENEWR